MKNSILQPNQLIYIATFIAALSQLVSPTFFKFNGFATVNPLIIPANYTFAIWGLITLGCAVFGGYQLFFPKLSESKFNNINLQSVLLFVCFTIWLWLAGLNQQFATLGVFLLMFALLININIKLVKVKLSNPEKVIVQAPFLLYLGWTTIAIFANFTSAIAEQGWIYNDERSLLSYIAILAAALGNAVLVGTKVKFNWYYVGTIIWAFIGIIVGSSAKSSVIVPAVCVFAILTMLGSKFYTSKKLTK
jgi:hypothetical protein